MMRGVSWVLSQSLVIDSPCGVRGQIAARAAVAAFYAWAISSVPHVPVGLTIREKMTS